MTGRAVEVQKVNGIQQFLDTTLLLHRAPESRPDEETYLQLVETAVELLRRSLDFLGEGRVVFTVLRWPESGPANYGLLIALNPRCDADAQTGQPYFVREFKDGASSDSLLDWTTADEQLVAYCVQQFGRPKLVG